MLTYDTVHQITGVSGHVGFRVLVDALKRGFLVRAVVRNAGQADQIRSTRSVKSYLDQLDFAVVPDLGRPSAFDSVLDSAVGVIHVASPLPSHTTEYKCDLIDPAANATVEVLESAKKVSTIKRVVITSSIGALLTWDYITLSDTTKVFTAWDAYTPPSLEGPFANVFNAYGVSKAAALAATDRFIKHEKPSFDVISILPSMVLGWIELNLTAKDVAKGSNATPLGVMLTTKTEVPTLGVSVHVEDVARAHLDALKPSILGDRNYICSWGGLTGTVWDDAKDFARQHFSEAVENGTLPLAGTQPSRPIYLDTSETEEAFGWKFASFDEEIKSVAGHYLTLLDAERAK